MAFYRSCTSEVRSKYTLLVAAMKRRFTPIRLTAVQAQLFHNRQQQTVDQFAQDLQKLYNLAYAGEGPQAGQTLRANQFITGLGSDLKRKLIGTEGSLEELVLKARFEEAKIRELVGDKPRTSVPTRTQRPVSGPGPSPTSAPPTITSTSLPRSTPNSTPAGARGGTRLKCYNCGLDGSMATWPGTGHTQGGADEMKRSMDQTKPKTHYGQKTMSALVGEGDSTRTKVEQLSKRLQDLEEKLTRESQTRVLNSVAAEPGVEDGRLGPSVTTKVFVNGVPTRALIDTGSPAITRIRTQYIRQGERRQQDPDPVEGGDIQEIQPSCDVTESV